MVWKWGWRGEGLGLALEGQSFLERRGGDSGFTPKHLPGTRDELLKMCFAQPFQVSAFFSNAADVRHIHPSGFTSLKSPWFSNAVLFREGWRCSSLSHLGNE